MRILGLALIIAGCGGDAGQAARGTVTVHVVRGEAAVGEASVVFHDPNGEVLGTALTDADGVAVDEIVTGSAVTVLDPSLEEYLTTITSVEPGSTLEVPLQSFEGQRESILTITAPATTPPPDTASYHIQTPCGDAFVESLPATIAVRPRCGAGTPIIVFAVSRPGLDVPGHTLAWAAALIDNDSMGRPAAWSTSCSVVARDGDMRVSLELRPRFGAHVFDLPSLEFCAVEPRTSSTLDFGEGALVHGVARVDGTAPRTTQLLRDVTPIPTMVEVNKDDLLFGWIALDSLDTQGASWTPNEALADTDAIDVTLQYISPGHFVHWRFVLPPDARETLLPAMPSELDTWGMPTQPDRVILDIRYVDARWVDGHLAAVHRELPLLVDGAASKHDIPHGSELRAYWQKFELP